MPNRTPADHLTGAERPDNLTDVRALLDRVRHDGTTYFPSPEDWRDQVLYFLLPDRFSDGADREMLTREELATLRRAPSHPDIDWRSWAASGRRWQGGTIAGIEKRLGYLEALGITALWIGPVFKQRVRTESYHGYGVQDFLEVDPRFGTRVELARLVAKAHARGIRVILDVIINHSGDNWGYVPPNLPITELRNEPEYRPFPDFYGNPFNEATRDWRVAWRDEQQRGFTTDAANIARPHDGVWPRELQDPCFYTRAGMGNLGENDVRDAHAEHKRTDFYSLKDFALDNPDALSCLADCFKYWIAITDCDGFRIDTVKHVSIEEARNFCGSIREFADTLHKRNFLLVGEIAGGDSFQDFVLDQLAVLERNLSAALDIGNARTGLADVAKGLLPARRYLDAFRAESDGFESHRALGNRHVSILDDHDHVIGDKLRFSALIPDDSPVKDYQVAAATAFQLFTLGIPCIYAGSEQALSGPPQSQIGFLLKEGWNDGGNYGDRYLREAMFGPAHPRAAFENELATQLDQQDPTLPGFGPFGTSGKHCFDTGSPAFVRIAHLCGVRAKHAAVRIGRQYPRQIRVGGAEFVLPPAGALVAWSRLLDNEEALCVVNPNGVESRGGDVVVSAELWGAGAAFVVVGNSAEAAATAAGRAYGGTHRCGSRLQVQRPSANGPAFVELRDVGPAEVVVLLGEP